LKITYTPNPLSTIVELDEPEQRELWYKIALEELTDLLFSVHYQLTHAKTPDMDQCKKDVHPDFYLGKDGDTEGVKTPLDGRADRILEHYLEELRGTHGGDCTCFAASCSKCAAEKRVGIDTIAGLGKHQGFLINCGFFYREGETWKERSLEDALERLRTYENPRPDWVEDARAAYEWLLAYRNNHFPMDNPGAPVTNHAHGVV
jgi:hypothetical protein